MLDTGQTAVAVGGPAVLALLRRRGKYGQGDCKVSRYLNIIFPPMQQAYDGVYIVCLNVHGLHGICYFGHGIIYSSPGSSRNILTFPSIQEQNIKT